MGALVYCLDASACSLLSEDYGPGTTRFHFQRELISCQSRACLTGGSGGHRHLQLAHSVEAQHQQHQQQVVLITSSGGKAVVAMHPSSELAALQQTLAKVQPVGEANLEAALKLALLVSRRFAAGSTHVTAFVASPGAAAGLSADHPTAAAAELWQRYKAAGVSLDVAVLGELSGTAMQALEALTGSSSSTSSVDEAGATSTATATPSSSSRIGRLVRLAPVEAAVESWQQLEPALELLEGPHSGAGSSSSSSTAGGELPGGSTAGRSSSIRAALPQHISRVPRQFDSLRHPRAPLLALRSGVQQPALCRSESLSRLGHLSSDGMARSWLPTYSSIAQQATAAAASSGSSSTTNGGTDTGMVYVEVQPIPMWRTLVKVAAGRMLAAPSADFAAASSELLRSLEVLDVLDDEEQSDFSSSGSSSGSGDSSRRASGDTGGAAEPPASVRYRPDERCGTLRLLQATKEPKLLKLVWSADREAEAAGQLPPLDMFGGGSGSSASASHAALLTYMPAATVAASAGRGPLVLEGCELWEATAEWDWELSLPTEAAGGSVGTAAGNDAAGAALPATLEAKQLPNGAQVLLVMPVKRRRRWQLPAAAAFWLHQRLGLDSLQPPAYASDSSSDELPAAAAASDSAPPAESELSQEDQQQGKEAAVETAEEATEQATEAGLATRVADALLRMLRRPPAVDLRRLRRDVKSGAIQISPITVGPLPAQFVRDIVSTRAAMMGGTGIENLDSWGEGGSSGGHGGSAGGFGTGAAPGSSKEAVSGSSRAEGGEAGSVQEGTAGSVAPAAASSAAADAMCQHKSAILSLLRQRLHKSRLGGRASRGGSGGQEVPAGPALATADGGAADTGVGQPVGEGAASPTAAIPFTLPPQSHHASESYESSGAGTTFGTPLHILPSRLVHERSSLASDAAALSSADPAGAAAAAADAEHNSLPDDGVKQEGGPAVLVGAGGQGEGGDGDPPMFQLE